MFEESIAYINTLQVLPELKAILIDMLTGEQERSAPLAHWALIPHLQAVFGDADNIIRPFAEAWAMMYVTASHLDHFQDGDQDALLERWTMPPSLIYMAMIGCLYGSQSILHSLPNTVPQHRIVRVYQLWTAVMLRMVGGQYRDLLAMRSVDALTHYQALAQAKAGAAFALAFGGVATLLNDDENVIATMTLLGELYGTLIQYHDDMEDIDTDSIEQITFPQSLLRSSFGNLHTPQSFLNHVTKVYVTKAKESIYRLPSHLHEQLIWLFESFE